MGTVATLAARLGYYRKFAAEAVRDIDLFAGDEKFRGQGGTIHYAVDFSEIYSYANNAPGGFLAQLQIEHFGTDSSRTALLEIHESVLQFLLFEATSELILLEPYGENLVSYQSGLRAKVLRSRMARLGASLAGVRSAKTDPEYRKIVDLARRMQETDYKLTTQERGVVEKFVTRHSLALIELSRDNSDGDTLARLSRLVHARKLQLASDLFGEDFSEDEEVFNRARKYFNHRRPDSGPENITDASALALLMNMNRRLLRQQRKSKVILVSRSSTMSRFMRSDISHWGAAGGNVVRHPQGFLMLLSESAEVDLKGSPDRRAAILRQWKSSLQRLANPDARSDLTQSETMNRNMAVITEAWRRYCGLSASERAFQKEDQGQDPLRTALAILYNEGALKTAIAELIADVRSSLAQRNVYMGVYIDKMIDKARRKLTERALPPDSSVDLVEEDAAEDSVRLWSPDGVPLPFDVVIDDDRLRNELSNHASDPLSALQALGTEGVMPLLGSKLSERPNFYEWYLCLGYVVAAIGEWSFADECLGLAMDELRLDVTREGSVLAPAEALLVRAKAARYLSRSDQDLVDLRKLLLRIADDVERGTVAQARYSLRFVSEAIKIDFTLAVRLAERDRDLLESDADYRDQLAAMVSRILKSIIMVDSGVEVVDPLNNLVYHCMQLQVLGVAWFEFDLIGQWFIQFEAMMRRYFGEDISRWPNNYVDTFAWVRLRLILGGFNLPSSWEAAEQSLILEPLTRLVERDYIGPTDIADFRRHHQEASDFFSEYKKAGAR